MVESQTIQIDRLERRGIIRVNRPGKANALNSEMLNALIENLARLGADETIHAVLVTGAGERVFCGGADLSEPETMSNSELWKNLVHTFIALPVPSFALINGACIGGGLTLALGCDIRIGVPESIFGYPVLRNQILPGEDEMKRLRQIMGVGAGSKLLLAGKRVSSEEALSSGLLTEIVHPDALLETGMTLSAAACESTRDHVIKLKSQFLWSKGRSPL